MARTETLAIPDIGDFKNIPVIELLVKPGDVVAADDTLIVLESDKATLDVPAPQAGRVKEVLVAAGDQVSMGTAFIVLETDDAAAPEVPAPAAAAPAAAAAPPMLAGSPVSAPASSPAPIAAASPAPTANWALPHAAPSVRRFARELGVDLALVTGSGPKNRIIKDDVQAFVQARLSDSGADARAGGAAGSGAANLDLLPWPQIDFSRFGPVERVPLSKIRQISGANLQRNAVIIPHVTNFDEADITELEAFRLAVNAENAATGPKLTILPFVIKATVAALRQFPAFNSSLDGDHLIQKGYYNIAFAADTPGGLVVPVIRDADKKGIFEIAAEAGKLAADAREGKLKLADMQGATFTITSLGGVGGTNFTPIINAPEVAILGMTRAQMKPLWDGAAFQPRLVQPLSLSWDHRVLDGVAAARFLAAICKVLADYRRIVL